MSCLEDILVNDIGLEYDPGNESHVRDLREVSKEAAVDIKAPPFFEQRVANLAPLFIVNGQPKSMSGLTRRLLDHVNS